MVESILKIICTWKKNISCKSMYKNEIILFKMQKRYRNIDPKVSSSSNGGVMVLSNCATCGSKKSRFIKNQQAKGLLRKLGIKTPLNKVPILSDILF